MTLTIFFWWSSQLSILRLSVRQALHNALILTLSEPASNIMMFLVQGVLFAVAVLLWPYTAVPILVGIPVLQAMAVAGAVNPILDRKVIQEEDVKSPAGCEEKINQ